MLQFTDSAVAKMREVMQEHDKPYIRFGVKGGGCAGFEYKMDVEAEKGDKDQVIEYGDVKILVDPVCEFYLLGTEVDYKRETFGSYFTYNNPNSASQCGCGTSFSVK